MICSYILCSNLIADFDYMRARENGEIKLGAGLQEYAFAELKRATNDFAQENRLGQGLALPTSVFHTSILLRAARLARCFGVNWTDAESRSRNFKTAISILQTSEGLIRTDGEQRRRFCVRCGVCCGEIAAHHADQIERQHRKGTGERFYELVRFWSEKKIDSEPTKKVKKHHQRQRSPKTTK